MYVYYIRVGSDMNEENKQYCQNSMGVEPCALKWLNEAIEESKQKIMIEQNTDEVRLYVKTLEDFIRTHSMICYGGSAINNILPDELQFYDKNDIPDYDVYSTTPMEHAKELADLYYNKFRVETTASTGVHEGTFKVYVNFILIADITFCPRICLKCCGVNPSR